MEPGSISAPTTARWGPSTPPELLLQLLRHLVPGAPRYDTERVDSEYIRQRSYFAQLRLVCAAWNGPVLPWAGRGVDLARSEFEKKVDERLRSCSRLCKLAFAEGDFTFLDRPSTVTSLRLVSVSRKTCSLALIGLGRNLTSLDIFINDTRHGPEKGPIHMPSIMPHLSRLTLKDYSDSSYDKQSILRKIIPRIIDEDKIKIPDSSCLDSPAVTTILTTNNIGAGLTSFAYPTRFLRPSQILSVIIPALKLCPRLQEFSLGSSCHGDVFKYLPHTLRRLEFVAGLSDGSDPEYFHDWDPPNPIGAFEKYLKSQAHSLEYVHAHLRAQQKCDVSKITSAWRSLLEDNGISHTIHLTKMNYTVTTASDPHDPSRTVYCSRAVPTLETISTTYSDVIGHPLVH
ncbi:hypothetical protein BD779DRAFT_1527795 [Infundibulicybe gibba]|nr:hypothetical protein BD779DRAFT_1527795 [Infundibulicybe gibba]